MTGSASNYVLYRDADAAIIRNGVLLQ